MASARYPWANWSDERLLLLRFKDLKVGHSVKALGFGDSLADLVAIDVNIEPPAAGKK